MIRPIKFVPVLSLGFSLILNACAPREGDTSPAPVSTPDVRIDYTPTGWTGQSLPEIAAALKTGEISSEQLVKDYLVRIAIIDQAGPTLQSILALNPNALGDAQALDARRAAGEPLGALHGVPILLKDNIESQDNVATTAGALALKDNITQRDAPLVAGLRASGAVILGKTNLSQWANFRSDKSLSGWSALGGQVRNPHMLDRNPCGSSSGSGAAIAASLGAGAVGTETNGSIICPSTVNGIVGFKPTVGLVAQDYIIPISSTQDTAGPMTRTVTGAAMMLTAMATGPARTDYIASLDAEALSGQRIGVMRFAEGVNPDIKTVFETALSHLEAAGAILVDIDTFDPALPDFKARAEDLLHYEFKAGLNTYLAKAHKDVTTRNLASLIAFNEAAADTELALFDQDLFSKAQSYAGLDDPAYAETRNAVLKAARDDGIDKLMATNTVSALIAPSGPIPSRIDPVNGDVWPEWAGAGWLAAIAGYPHITVPMGHVHGLPVGLSIMGAKDQDARVLSYGYAYEHVTQHRIEPQYRPSAEARPEIKKALSPVH